MGTGYRLLLTGASGFLGKNLLLGAPPDWRILAVYRAESDFPEFVRSIGRDQVTPVRCDLADAADVERMFGRYGDRWDACVHLAAAVDIPWSVRDPSGDLRANVLPLLNLLERIHVGKFVYFSSGAVYDGLEGEVHPLVPVSPTLPYAISKLAAERYVACYAQRKRAIDSYLIVRFFGAYGPYEPPHKIYTRLIRAFDQEGRNEYTIYGDGKNLIDAMYIDDAVAAIRKMLAGSCVNEIVNLAAGQPLTIEMLVREVARVLGAGPIHIRKDGIANESNRFWGSTAEMRDLFGFLPGVSLASGILRFREAMRRTAPATVDPSR